MDDTPRQPAAPDRPDSVAEWLALKDRALDVAAEGVTIADARLPDRPLIYANEGFERMTGYPVAEVMGRNCRFLQGPDTDANAVAEIRSALTECRACVVEILNYRQDRTTFWNRLSITPVRDGSGEVTHFIGIQSDVTARRLAEDALRVRKKHSNRTCGWRRACSRRCFRLPNSRLARSASPTPFTRATTWQATPWASFP